MEGEPRPFSELSSAGLLWLINRVVFHPRGFMLAFHVNEVGEAIGWSLQGDGSEVVYFTPEIEDQLFMAAQATLGIAGGTNS